MGTYSCSSISYIHSNVTELMVQATEDGEERGGRSCLLRDAWTFVRMNFTFPFMVASRS